MKRRRTYASAKSSRPFKKPRTTGKSIIVPGLTRRVGFYGRYQRSASSRYGSGAEKKFFDTDINFNFDATGEIPANGQLTLIPQGDTESTRDGRKAVIKSIQIRGNMVWLPGAGTTASSVAYFYCILDTQCNGAAALITDVFTSATMNQNLLNLNNSGRFRILKRWVIPQASGAGVSGAYGGNQKSIEWFKKCNIPVDWSGATGALTEIRSNNIFLMAGATTDDLQSFAGVARLRFQG